MQTADGPSTTRLGHFEDAKTLPMRTFPTLGSAQAWFITDDKAAATAVGSPSADSAYIKSIYAGPQDYQSQMFGNPQASYEGDVSVSGTTGRTQYFLSGTSKYDNGTMRNTGYNKQSIRSNLTQEFAPNFHVSANLSYVHDNTRRSITGNDNIGIAPYNVFSTTPQFVKLNTPVNGLWAQQSVRHRQPVRRRGVDRDPREREPVHRRRNTRLDGLRAGARVPQADGDRRRRPDEQAGDLLYAPPTLQVEQQVPSGLPGTSVSNSATTQYYNYAFNLTHHYSGLSFLDAVTSLGYTLGINRSTLNPVTVSKNLLTGVNTPTVGTVQQNFLFRTAQYDQSWYGQEQLGVLRLAAQSDRRHLTGGAVDQRRQHREVLLLSALLGVASGA